MGLSGRWRLTESCVDYSTPWKALDWAEILEEYGDFKCPGQQYMHHLINRHEGEVAKAWVRWSYSKEPLPRDAFFWDPQFAASQQNFEALKLLRFEKIDGGIGTCPWMWISRKWATQRFSKPEMVILAIGSVMAVELRWLSCSSNSASITQWQS